MERIFRCKWPVAFLLATMLAVIVGFWPGHVECVKAETLKAPYGVMIPSISDKGINVYWKKPSQAAGYEVWRSYEKDGEYSMAKDIEDPAGFEWYDKDFDHSKRKVFYKVIAYKYGDDGTKIYSDFSKTVKASYRNSFILERYTVYMFKGYARRLGAYYGWGNAKGCKWSSSNRYIATVDSKGRITAKGKGECYIYCRTKHGTLRCRVVVDRSADQPLSKITSRYKKKSKNIWVSKKSKKKSLNTDKADSAVIMMVGDLMCVGPQQNDQGYATGNYNFNESFSEIRKTIKSSDLAIGNLETLLSSSWPYMHEEGYINNKPNCNAPSRYLDALKYAGFDALVMANNHNCDGRENGLKETIEQVDRYKFARTGAFKNSKDNRTLMVNVNDINVGILSYVTQETGYNKKDSDWSKKSINTMLNYFSPEKVKSDIAALKKKGAEYIIVYMHWGIKNDPEVKPSMKNAAQTLANLGADFIVGGHSHLVQSFEEIISDSGKVVPCYYSVGDFQTATDQITGNRDSIIVRIQLEKGSDGKVVLKDNSYIPCFTYTNYKNKKYVTVKVDAKHEAYKRIAEALGDGARIY